MKNPSEINRQQRPKIDSTSNHISEIGTGGGGFGYGDDQIEKNNGARKKSGFLEGTTGKLVLIALPILITIMAIKLFWPYPSWNQYVKDIDNLQIDLQNVHKIIDPNTAGITTLGGLNDKLTGYDNKFTTFQNAFSSLNATISTNVSSSISSMLAGYAKTTDLNKLQNDVTNLVNNNSAVTTLQSQVKSLGDSQASTTTTINNLSSQVNTLKTQVAALMATPTPTPTPTPTTGGSTTPPLVVLSNVKVVAPTTGITANIIPSYFTQTTNMTLNAITAVNKNATGSITIEVVNSTSSAISGVQLAVSLGVFDNTNPANPIAYTLPTGVTPSLVSNGNLAVIWNQATTGVGYVLGFINQVNNGLYSFGNLTVQPGTTNLQEVFTVNAN